MKSISFSQLKNLFQKKPKVPGARNPGRDWMMIIGITAGVFVLVLCAGLYMFFGTEQGTLFAPDEATSTATASIDQASINKIDSYYSDRAAKITSIKASPANVVDPSL